MVLIFNCSLSLKGLKSYENLLLLITDCNKLVQTVIRSRVTSSHEKSGIVKILINSWNCQTLDFVNALTLEPKFVSLELNTCYYPKNSYIPDC